MDRLASQCARDHAVKKFRSPIAMLIYWLKKAEQLNTDRIGIYPASEWSPSPLGERSDPEYAALRLGVLQQVRAGMTPAATADVPAARWGDFAHLPYAGVAGGLGDALDEEIAELRAKGATW